MALRILQFGLLLTIGLPLCPVKRWAEAALTSSSTGGLPGTPHIHQQFPSTDDDDVRLKITLHDPEDVVVARGKPATLRCDVQSSSKVDVEWLHNGKLVPVNDIRRVQQSDHSLYISRVVTGKRSVTGEYKCRVRTPTGILLSSPAKLRIASFDRDFNNSTQEISVAQLQAVILPCRIHSTPTARIQWEHDNLPLPHNSRHVPLPTGALLIRESTLSDAGTYKCTATNSVLQETKEKIINLTVLPPLKDVTASAFLPLDTSPNVVATVGQNVNLYCVVNGWPLPKVQWLNSDNIVIANTSVLTIPNVDFQSTSNYSCTAYNSVNRVTQKYTLQVQQKPYFVTTPSSKTFPSGRTVRLDCQAKGHPEPRIYWLKNGEPLANEARIKKQPFGLLFSHTFTDDDGIYQCVAVNAAGMVWAAAQLKEIVKSPIPPPPKNVQCRSYDDSSICVVWDVPPKNISVVAYTIYSFFKKGALEIPGNDYLANETHTLATGLNTSTKYTFYVRLYTTSASDKSSKVTCQTGIQGERNLVIEPKSDSEVVLTWNRISYDIPCGAADGLYKVQWRKKGYTYVNVERTKKTKHVISGLHSATEYEFKVFSTSYPFDTHDWISLETPSNKNATKPDDDWDGNNTTEVLHVVPENLEATSIQANAINLVWQDLGEITSFYTVCFSEVKERLRCENGTLLTSSTNSLQIAKLKPNTLYEIKVRAHNSEGSFGPFSHSLEVKTPPDVPSPVLGLKYKVINETSVCLKWFAPVQPYAKLIEYVISYTPDQNWPPDEWICHKVPISQLAEKSCWKADDNSVSAMLVNLEPRTEYSVLVRARSEIGTGKPTVPIQVSTLVTDENGEHFSDTKNELAYKQKLGVVLGCVIALVCIICCVSCILVRRQCIKRRSMANDRINSSNNYYPAVAHYASQGSTVQVRLEDPCAAELHEIQHLVEEEHPTHIPPNPPVHLDTKGGDGFPNGTINGSSKQTANGHVPNGHVHITENPQYFVRKRGAKLDGKLKGDSYQEDPNSNIQTSKFKDLQSLFEISKRSWPNKYEQCNFQVDPSSNELKSLDSTLNGDCDSELDSTQLTCLDDSFIIHNHRRISPLLGPNG